MQGNFQLDVPPECKTLIATDRPNHLPNSVQIMRTDSKGPAKVLIALSKSFNIRGQILLSDGKPFNTSRLKQPPLVTVFILGIVNGLKRTVRSRSSQADSKGVFSFSDLYPGEYYLRVDMPPQEFTIGRPNPEYWSQNELAETIVSTMYPSALGLEDGALPVRAQQDIGAGNVVIRMRTAKTLCYEGVVEGEKGNSNANIGDVSISILPAEQGKQVKIAQGIVAAGSNFFVCGIPQGMHKLLYAAKHSGLNAFVIEDILFDKRNLSHPAQKVLEPQFSSLAIRVVEEEPNVPIPSFSRLPSVRLTPAQRIQLAGEVLDAGNVEGGGLLVPSLFANEEYRVEVTNIPSDRYLVGIFQGGKDISASTAVSSNGDLQIVLSAKCGKIEGSAVQPLVGELRVQEVIFVRDDVATPWMVPHGITMATVNEKGAFSSGCLPGGSYKISPRRNENLFLTMDEVKDVIRTGITTHISKDKKVFVELTR